MTQLTKEAGDFTIEVFTDGWPLNFKIVRNRDWGSGTVEFNNTKIEDLHDLRYCIDRILELVAQDKRK